MAKLVGFSSFFLVLLAMLVVSTYAQELPRVVCSKPSQNEALQKSCMDNKACQNACITDKKSDASIISGMCETVWSFNQSGFDKCVKEAMSSRPGCSNDDDNVLLSCATDPFVKEDCTSKNMIKTGTRCICLYDCPNP